MKRTSTAKKSIPAKDIDAYLAALPKETRAVLGKLRRTIKEAAPDAVEVISYRIPIYKHLGMLVGFAAFKDHCSFMVLNPSVMGKFKDELGSYVTTEGTIHFTVDKPLPAALVKRMVKERIKQNEEHDRIRKMKAGKK